MNIIPKNNNPVYFVYILCFCFDLVYRCKALIKQWFAWLIPFFFPPSTSRKHRLWCCVMKGHLKVHF